MGLSYNEAKKLVNKGRRLKDGGSTTLEKFMPVKAKNGKVTRINKDDTMKAKAGQFKNIANASASGGISPEEALKKIRKLVISKKDGGALKDLPSGSENPGLRKLPTEVRNKMGYKKKGGTMKMMSGGGVARGTGAAVKGTGFKGVY